MIKVPFVDLKSQYQSIKNEMDAALQNVIENTAFIGGSQLKEFEASFAQLLGVEHVVSCANGTDSLYIIMKALGIGPGDEVITVANSWISSSETIGQTGAKPVFVDIDPTYLSMDVEKFEQKITAKTKAVIAVHLHGQMAEIGAIKSICDARGIFLIEDCAQSHLSESNGKIAGTFGIAGSFSFYPGKNLGAYGDAGCIVTNDAELAIKCRMFANHGALKKHHHEIEGINSRLDGIQAAVLNVKLPHLKDWTNSRRNNAVLYRQALAGIKEIRCIEEKPNTKHSYHLFIILCENRDALKTHLEALGIETAIHYPTPLPLLKAYASEGYTEVDYANSAYASAHMLSLPIYPELSGEQIEYVAKGISDFYAQR
jgi:dTDP-4-amino-4,6-dideoxygalactose transaminase